MIIFFHLLFSPIPFLAKIIHIHLLIFEELSSNKLFRFNSFFHTHIVTIFFFFSKGKILESSEEKSSLFDKIGTLFSLFFIFKFTVFILSSSYLKYKSMKYKISMENY
jgi:hypothetical protein